MRYLLFTLVLFYSAASAQVIGVGLGGATSSSFIGDVVYIKNGNRFHLGFAFQKNGQKGQAVNERLSNYGSTTSGSGKYFTSFDFGYSRVYKNKLTIQPELTFGWTNTFINYNDGRFNGDAYHLVVNSKSIFGAGCNFGYIFHPNFEFYSGFNSIKIVSFGIRVLI